MTMHGMKKTTIKKVTEKVLGGFFETILDEDVRKLAEQNTIVTGGAITSMLLGEKPNDYDLYFESIEVAEAVANYYVAQYNNIENQGEKIVRDATYTPVVKRETITNIRGEDEERLLIWMQSAGVTGEDQGEYGYSEYNENMSADFLDSTLQDQSDMDIVENTRQALQRSPTASRTKYRPVYMTDNAITLSDKIQLVIRFHGTPEEIHDNYDFAHCMCYYRSKTREVVLPPEALESILTKSLIYKGSLYPIASVLRTRKFIQRGWRITAGQMLKMMFQINEINLGDPKILREQLIGVDHAYMIELIKALNNAGSYDRVDATYLGKLIDQVFEDGIVPEASEQAEPNQEF